MKLKYYLRGLGLGMLITAALFLSMGSNTKNTMTDAQVRARAIELGMIENPTLKQLEEEKVTETQEEETITEVETEEISSIETTEATEEATETTAEENTEAATEENTQIQTEEKTQPEENIKEMGKETTPTKAVEPEKEETKVTSGSSDIIIVVNKGEGSDTVSRKLFEAGLITDAKNYDKYLMQNGYDKRIAAGEHHIPASANEEEIAKILCSRK